MSTSLSEGLQGVIIEILLTTLEGTEIIDSNGSIGIVLVDTNGDPLNVVDGKLQVDAV